MAFKTQFLTHSGIWSRVAAAIVDSSGRVTEVNEALADQLNRPASSLVGVDLLQAMKANAADHARSVSGDVFCIDGGDVPAWLRLDRSPADASHELGRLTNVTAEWTAMRTLAAARTIRDKLLHDAAVGTWRFDPDQELYHFSSELALGHATAAEPVPLSILRLVQHADDQDKDTEIRERLTTQGGAADGEMRYRDGSGGWKTLRVHYRAGRKLASGKHEMFGISQNVTELAVSRDNADLMSGRLELAMAAANAGVYEIDLRTGQRWSSEQFNLIAGPEAMERQEQSPFGIYQDDEVAEVRKSWERCLASNAVESLDTRIYHPDGQGRWVRLFTQVERSVTGENIRAVGMMLDIHAQKMQELALTEAKAQAEAATVAKSSFLAAMSHEIRTPFNGFLGITQVLAADPLTESQREQVNVISKSGQTLMALLNDVLDISKIEAGKLDIARIDGLFLVQLAPRIVEAVNGEQALERLSEQPFDIVLLDVPMPVTDGRETIRRIRASGQPWSRIPVIALTADAMSGDRERYLGLGMDDYISKPIDARELATRYVRLLKGHKRDADAA